MKKIILPILLFVLVITLLGCEPGMADDKKYDERNLDPQMYTMMSLAGTDALGREIKPSDNVKTDKKRYVGLFYSVWLGQHAHMQTGIYNIAELLQTEEGTQILFDPAGSDASRTDEFHYWGEPLFGYYNSSDPWVATRHVEMLTLAGIDYLAIDTTNAAIYQEPVRTLLDTLLKYHNQGFAVPKIIFYTNSHSGTTVDKLYLEFYQTDKYYDVWFRFDEKPVIIGITEENNRASDQTKYYPFDDFIAEEYHDFFDIYESQWPNGDFNEKALPWMSWQSPQWIHNGSVSVPVAQHSHTRISVSNMDPETKRGYNNLTGMVEENFRAGASFQTMWDNVFSREDDIFNVMVTSFNEWMAIKLLHSEGVHFVDVFDEEHSRDIDLMKGGFNDNFYLQLIQNVRRFKYTDYVEYNHKLVNIDIQNPNALALWDYVNTHYKDFAGDAMARDHQGAVASLRYVDNSNRNDITDIKVAHNKENLYFYIKTLDHITPYNGTDLNWMNVFIQTNDDEGFAGFQYVINRNPNSTTTSLEKSTGGYNFTKVGDVKYTILNNVMQIEIPLLLLGLNANNVKIDFKVADNVTHYEDIMDYYVTGDSAPIGRLKFRY